MKRFATIISAAALGLGIAACGSSSNTSTNASAASGTSGASRYQARLDLAKCLRQHGLNVPDPSADGSVPGGVGPLLRTLRADPNFRPAMQACAKYRAAAFPFTNLSPAQRAQFRQAFVKFAECMRAHGVNIPDPGTGGDGGFGLRQSISPSLRQSPAFQTAIKACITNLPFRRGGAPGGLQGGAISATPGA